MLCEIHVPMTINDVPVECIESAAISYHVDINVLLAVLKTEGGHVGSKTQNKNGTYDLGPMQINSSRLIELEPYGFTETKLRYDPIANIEAGAWILSNSIAEAKSLEQGIGNYHSHTLKHNHEYSQKVINKLNQINRVVGLYS